MRPGRILPTIALAAITMHSIPQAASLRLATWNLQHLTEESGAGCRPRQSNDYRELRRTLQRSEADIIAFQEVENAQAATRIFDPQRYWVEISNRPAARHRRHCRKRRTAALTEQHTGFAISKTALGKLGMSYRRLPDFTDLGIAGLRWGTQIVLRPPNKASKPLRLLSVHLKSGCAYNPLSGSTRRYACRMLIRQRGILAAWIDERAESDERFAILGDFNRQLDQPRDQFWQEIDDGETCDRQRHPTLGSVCTKGSARANRLADLILANAGTPFPFPRNPRYPYAIDHLMLDADSAGRLIDGSYQALDYGDADPAPSDHHLISIDLRFRTE